MPEEGGNILSFQNYKNQMKMHYVIYADFEAIIRKILGCECERMQTSYTEKTERHKACGYSFMVVRSDGKVVCSKAYRGETAVGKFLSDILQEEEKIRESLATPKPIVMTDEDWENFKKATDCHICNKSLIKDEFLDSLPVGTSKKSVKKAVKNGVIGAKATKDVSTWHRKSRNGAFKG